MKSTIIKNPEACIEALKLRKFKKFNCFKYHKYASKHDKYKTKTHLENNETSTCATILKCSNNISLQRKKQYHSIKKASTTSVSYRKPK